MSVLSCCAALKAYEICHQNDLDNNVPKTQRSRLIIESDGTLQCRPLSFLERLSACLGKGGAYLPSVMAWCSQYPASQYDLEARNTLERIATAYNRVHGEVIATKWLAYGSIKVGATAQSLFASVPRMDLEQPPIYEEDPLPAHLRPLLESTFTDEVRRMHPVNQIQVFNCLLCELENELREPFEKAKQALQSCLDMIEDPARGDWKKQLGTLDTQAGALISDLAIIKNGYVYELAVNKIVRENPHIDFSAKLCKVQAVRRKILSVRACSEELMQFVNAAYNRIPPDEREALIEEWCNRPRV